jgi:hypothetical protein
MNYQRIIESKENGHNIYVIVVKYVKKDWDSIWAVKYDELEGTLSLDEAKDIAKKMYPKIPEWDVYVTVDEI